MTRLLLVCAGGAVGSGARYLLAILMARVLGTAFPWGTLLVNVIGCFLLAAIVHGGHSLDPALRLALTAGVTGGFTTYSAFNQDNIELALAGAWLRASANVAATLIGCAMAGVLGVMAGRTLS